MGKRKRNNLNSLFKTTSKIRTFLGFSLRSQAQLQNLLGQVNNILPLEVNKNKCVFTSWERTQLLSFGYHGLQFNGLMRSYK